MPASLIRRIVALAALGAVCATTFALYTAVLGKHQANVKAITQTRSTARIGLTAAGDPPIWMLPWMASPGPSLHDISGYTYMCGDHTGADAYAIDFHLTQNSPVGAIYRGTVYATGFDTRGGNYVIIKDINGYYSYYGHLTSYSVAANQKVREGDQIGLSGDTGAAQGYHLHFRITSGSSTGTAVKPEPMGGFPMPYPATSFGNWGYSNSHGCAWNTAGPGYYAKAPAVAITSRYYFGDYWLDGYGDITAVNGAPTIHAVDTYNWAGWNIARDFKICPSDDTKGYLLDGYGGIHAVGNATPVPAQYRAYFPNNDIARSIAIYPDCQSGYTLDGDGGIHPFAANGVMPPQETGYLPHQDIVRQLIVVGQNPLGVGYTLDAYGFVHPFGGAPTISPDPDHWSNWDIARGMIISVDSPCCSGFKLDGYGGLHPIGTNVPTLSPSDPYWPGYDVARGVSFYGDLLNSVCLDALGGNLVDIYGGIHPFTSANAC